MVKILICDDQVFEVWPMFSSIFSIMGHQISGAETPEEALRDLQTSRYQCVFLDLQTLSVRDTFIRDAYDYPAKFRELQPDIVVIGYSAQPGKYLREARGHFDEVVNKLGLFIDDNGECARKLEELLKKHGI